MDQSTADALNKAIDLAKQGVVAAFETVKEYAPQVWAMARRQTLLDGVELLVGVVLVIGAGTTIISLSRSNMRNENNSWDDYNHMATVIITMIIGGIICSAFLINAIDLIGNPDWWTMQRVLDLVKR